jgi:DNA-binding MarR family transcriptional regulator
MVSGTGDEQERRTGTDVPAKVVVALDRLARGMRAHRQAVASAAGISVLQAELLRTLAEGQPPPAFAGPLALELGVSQPTVSDSLTALERKGYVRRVATPQDRRRSTFLITESGSQLAADLATLDEALLAGATRLAPPAQDQLLTALLSLITCLLESGALAVARTCPTCRFFDEAEAGPRCSLLQVALAPSDLRVNCPEHQPASRPHDASETTQHTGAPDPPRT